MRLQLKLALVLVPLVAGPVLALGWVSYDALRQDLEDTAVQSWQIAGSRSSYSPATTRSPACPIAA